MGKTIRERFIARDPNFDVTKLIEEPSFFQALEVSREKEDRNYFVGIHMKEIFEGKNVRLVQISLEYRADMPTKKIKEIRRQINDYISERVLDRYCDRQR